MDLEQYLSEIESCDDKKLTSRFGVYDNYLIVLGLKYIDAKFNLDKLSRLKFQFEDSVSFQKILISKYFFDDNIHTITLWDRKYPDNTFSNEINKKISDKKFESYIFIQPYQNESVFDKQREMASVINYLSKDFLIKNKIPAFFPNSIGQSRNTSKLVFYEPEN